MLILAEIADKFPSLLDAALCGFLLALPVAYITCLFPRFGMLLLVVSAITGSILLYPDPTLASALQEESGHHPLAYPAIFLLTLITNSLSLKSFLSKVKRRNQTKPA
ncbi:hypothetical protein SAMN02745181_3750 [Rubritalea squalenifaciens DSM 18772]|uniref:Uncharacterized protein n=1 Tax=Rubritalea squalenifaciens DSM 18772 TaxID=1123071 RepID=A0A1M6S8I1_9BACT|nr:hypothetical protein [Rubritalea squalenifaciens]SHK40971.1 hypothetical protein SAMN02745181_3750 [Rubritalea squalenifaciens DSM 18772]